MIYLSRIIISFYNLIGGEMVEDPKQAGAKLKSLQEDFEELKEEIGNIHREIEIKHQS